MGNLFLSTTDYAQLPRPNWDTLKRYSTKNTIGSNSAYGGTNGITTLINPPIGDQAAEGSCVGWAVGYTAMGILTYLKYYCWNTARRSNWLNSTTVSA